MKKSPGPNPWGAAGAKRPSPQARGKPSAPPPRARPTADGQAASRPGPSRQPAPQAPRAEGAGLDIQLGRQYALPIIKRLSFGVYLDAGTLGEILLPNKFVPPGLQPGDSVSVFLYQDSEDRPVATTQTPLARVGEFAYLRVVDSNRVGAFLDWGLDKDLLVPFPEQHRPLEKGKACIAHVYIDQVHGRITASSKIDKFLKEGRPHRFQADQEVDLLIANSTELGYKAIVDNSHWGVLHKADAPSRLSYGQRLRGFIKHVRPDGRLDLRLRSAEDQLDRQAAVLLAHLREQGGSAALGNHTPPADIEALLGFSKSVFKRAVGRLLSQGRIELYEGGIRLKPSP